MRNINFIENDDSSIIEDISMVKLFNTTNNESALYAIYLGILQAVKFRSMMPNKIKQIYLFSDSKISLIGIREWIYKWVNNVKDGLMLSSSGKPVANQAIILRCIQLMLENDLEVVLSHTDGHVNLSVKKELYNSVFFLGENLQRVIIDGFSFFKLEKDSSNTSSDSPGSPTIN